MDNQSEVKLSSNWTSVGLYFSAILCLIFIPVFIGLMTSQEFHIGMLIGGLGFLLLGGFVIYQFIYVCDARVVGDKLVLKKQFRSPKSYSFDRIGYPTSFQLKNTKYITVEMKNDNGSMEKYLILNSRAILSFENKDAEQALVSLRNMAMANNKQ